jgi:oxygen-independent coproporphyrinogen-3 oxidase
MAATILTAPFPRLSFDPDLVRKYDGLGPRYTSYPTADRFTEAFTAEHLANALLDRLG